MQVLSLNVGSSSIKYAVYEMGQEEKRLIDGTIEKNALQKLREGLAKAKISAPQVIGHRLVFGGVDFYQPTKINRSVLSKIKKLTPFAPLHLPPAIGAIELTQELYPHAQQVACFDTAFHHDLPEVSQTLPLPLPLRRAGLRRFGFHGLSYEYVLGELSQKRRKRCVIAHLGNGASLAAIRNGKCIDTTMGLTPSGGVIMSARSGDLDPGILVYLMREKGYDVAKIDELINHKSGLLAVSNESADFRTLLSSKSDSARLAIDMFCYQVSKTIGGFAAALDGLDALVFAGGVGENSAMIRAKICDALRYLGLKVNAKRNQQQEGVISAKASSCCVMIIPTNEELMIARHAAASATSSAILH